MLSLACNSVNSRRWAIMSSLLWVWLHNEARDVGANLPLLEIGWKCELGDPPLLCEQRVVDILRCGRICIVSRGCAFNGTSPYTPWVASSFCQFLSAARRPLHFPPCLQPDHVAPRLEKAPYRTFASLYS